MLISILYPRECFIDHSNEIRNLRPERHKYLISPSGHFYIHYDTAGNAAPNLEDLNYNGVPDYVEEVGIMADSSYNVLVNLMGFQEEPFDGEGGYDIYLMNYSSGIYGYNYLENNSTSYMTIDNDYLGFNSSFGASPIQLMRVTVAHEYFHALHWGYNASHSNSLNLYEMSSMWFEDVIMPDVNDYLDWIDPLIQNPTLSINNSQIRYALSLFGHYLTNLVDSNNIDNFTNSIIIRQLWEHHSVSDGTLQSALEHVLDGQQYSLSFIEAWVDFIARNLYNSEYESLDNPYYYHIDQSLIDPISTSLTILSDLEFTLPLNNHSVFIQSFFNDNEAILDLAHSNENISEGNSYLGRIAMNPTELLWIQDSLTLQIPSESVIHFLYASENVELYPMQNLDVTFFGCTDSEACNYDEAANVDDGSCTGPYLCDDGETLECNLDNCPLTCDFGDVNCDDTLDILDIILIVNLSLIDEYDEVADINQDGSLDILDIVTFINWVIEATGSIIGSVINQYGEPQNEASIVIDYISPSIMEEIDGFYGNICDSFGLSIALPVPMATDIELYVEEFCTEEIMETLVDDSFEPGHYYIPWDINLPNGQIYHEGEYNIVLNDSVSANFTILTIDHSCQTIETIYPLTITDFSGNFFIDQSCLPFGNSIPIHDEFGNLILMSEIERLIRICAYIESGYNCTDPIYVNPNIEVIVPTIIIYE